MITRECRYGTFSWLETDEFVGRALKDYGEYSEDEVNVFRQILLPGDVAVDVGANIGALTVPMAQLVGPTGKVYAYEPGHNNLAVLATNVRHSRLENVEIVPFAASDKAGEVEVVPVASPNLWRRPEESFITLGDPVKVPTVPIDSLKLEKCKFVKIDVDGMEIETLVGMDSTIKRCRPLIYIENEQKNGCELIAALTDRGYRMWWHRATQFNPDNFRGNKRNWFGPIVSIMMLCVPEEFKEVEIVNLEEVGDIRDDDDMFEREVWRYNRYVKRHPDDGMARTLLVHNLNLTGRRDEAENHLKEGLRRLPDFAPLLGLKALFDLQDGNYDWQANEVRFRQPGKRQFGGHRREQFDKQAPRWNGERTDDRVLIWSEQGFGDMIQAVRLMPHILERAPHAILECHSALYELFEQSHVAPTITRLGRTLPKFDSHCSMISAYAALDATPEMLRSSPYLKADEGMIETWRERGNPREIGICHKGSDRSERPLTRDIPTHFFDPLNARYSPFFNLVQTGQFDDFASTAAAIAVLDLVITVDTSIAHLAGAMGKPVWLLLSTEPDWRWTLHGDTTLWYPSMRIFRQRKFRDWKSVIDDVIAALDEREQKQQAA